MIPVASRSQVPFSISEEAPMNVSVVARPDISVPERRVGDEVISSIREEAAGALHFVAAGVRVASKVFQGVKLAEVMVLSEA